MISSRAIVILAALALGRGALPARAQQVSDPDFAPRIAHPAYATGAGPVVLLDEAHYNFHTTDGRYAPFVALLRADGYVVRGSRAPFAATSLREARVLVIANALAERNRMNGNATDWSLPTPSAFTADEIAAVREWVRGGGSLLLIADHMPFGGAAVDLAAALGAHFSNAFAFDGQVGNGLIVFRRSDGSLRDHAITGGRSPDERVDSVAAFTGQAFTADAEPLMVMGPAVVGFLPQTAWQFTAETPRESVAGRFQGAARRFGAGRVAFFGEAAMFSAQVAGPNRQPMGMNAPIAGQNQQFALNALHWLSGLLN
ncbi:MAG: DUF4350 domain-containing protein [Gemmatimonadales bacterium]